MAKPDNSLFLASVPGPHQAVEGGGGKLTQLDQGDLIQGRPGSEAGARGSGCQEVC